MEIFKRTIRMIKKNFGSQANGNRYMNVIGTILLLLISIIGFFGARLVKEIDDIAERQRQVVNTQSEMKVELNNVGTDVGENNEALKRVEEKLHNHIEWDTQGNKK